MTVIVPEVEASCVPVMPTSGNENVVWPPPLLEVGFLGFVIVTVKLPAFAVVRSEDGTLIVSEVPAALTVPVSGGLLPKVTVVELLNPAPVMVICCAEVAPAISPTFGEKEDSVGAALLTVAVSVAEVLSAPVELPSFGSDTLAVFCTEGYAPGATIATIGKLLLAAAAMGPALVHVTT